MPLQTHFLIPSLSGVVVLTPTRPCDCINMHFWKDLGNSACKGLIWATTYVLVSHCAGFSGFLWQADDIILYSVAIKSYFTRPSAHKCVNVNDEFKTHLREYT